METLIAGYTLGLILMVSGWAIRKVAQAGKSGTLSRNAIAGVRTRATMSSDEAWAAAHMSAAGPTAAGGAICFASGVASILVAILLSSDAIADSLASPLLLAIVTMGTVALLGFCSYGCFVGNRAAEAAAGN